MRARSAGRAIEPEGNHHIVSSIAEHFGLDPEAQILHRNFLQPVEVHPGENNWEFLG